MVEVAHDITEEPVETAEEDAIDEIGTGQSTSEEAVSEEASSGESTSEESTSEETTPDDVEHAFRDLVQETRIVEALLFAAT